MNTRNPFLNADDCGAMSVEDRLECVRSFSISQCEAALNMPIQKTVRKAIERRIRKLGEKVMTKIKHSELPELLSPLGGGFFIGKIIVDGVLHALIVAPKADGETKGKWGEFGESIDAKHYANYANGLASTNAMAEAGSEIALWARGLRIGGLDDWHIPARDQLELVYRHCKPISENNIASFRDGENPSSVPVNYPYTDQSPTQCENPTFQSSGAEAFDEGFYWSSTQYSANFAWGQDFYGGSQFGVHEGFECRVRAVRMIPISD
ncbi:MAG TPA: DUF1566 domain-containing protein [Gammaproteobacteria bacterium]|nr:DUF1566 domain-containing protein [Gammaproteobacteria bacterium]